MKKRFLSVLLAVCMVLTLLPATAMAAATKLDTPANLQWITEQTQITVNTTKQERTVYPGDVVWDAVSGGTNKYTGEVYNNTSDTTRDKKQCTSTTDKQNAEIVLPLLQSEMGQQGPYSATGVGGMSCRTYSNDAYNRIKQALRSAGG